MKSKLGVAILILVLCGAILYISGIRSNFHPSAPPSASPTAASKGKPAGISGASDKGSNAGAFLAATEADPAPAAAPVPTPFPIQESPLAASSLTVFWADSGEPAAGATVTLTGTVAFKPIDWKAVQLSDSQGRATFQIPDALDQLIVEAVHPKGAYFRQTCDRRNLPSPSVYGFAPLWTDPMTIWMQRGGAIAGVVKRKNDGKPVPDAIIHAYVSGGTAGKTVSGPDGSYRIDGLPAEGVRLEASAPGLFAEANAGTISSAGEKGAASVAPALTMMPTGELTGYIRAGGLGGRPIEGAIVRVENMSSDFLAKAVTHADGSYRLQGIPADRENTIVATHPEFAGGKLSIWIDSKAPHRQDIGLAARAKVDFIVKDRQGQPVAAALVAVRGGGSRALTDASGRAVLDDLELGGHVSFDFIKPGLELDMRSGLSVGQPKGEQSQLEIVMRPVATPTAVVAGVVRDSSGNPVEGAEVVFGTGLHYDEARVGGARSAADGSYRIGPVAVRALSLVVARKEGFALQAVEIRPEQAGGAPVIVDFQLVPPALLKGRVVAEDKSPLAGAVVDAMVQVDTSPLTRLIPRVRTDIGGNFEFKDLPDLGWYLTAKAEGFSRSSVNAGRFESGADIVIRPAGIYRGQVVDADTKKPIRNFRASYRSFAIDPLVWRLIDDPSGEFTIDNIDIARAGVLRVESDGYGPFEKSRVSGHAAAAQAVAIELKRYAAIQIVVSDKSSGAPVPGAEILAGIANFVNSVTPYPSLDGPTGSISDVANLVSDASGAAALPEAGPEKTIRVRAKGYAPVLIRPEDRGAYANGPRKLLVALAPESIVAGRAQVNGQFAGGDTVTIRSAAPGPIPRSGPDKGGPFARSQSVVAGADGGFSFGALGAGYYRLAVEKKDSDGRVYDAVVKGFELGEGVRQTENIGDDAGFSALFGLVANAGKPVSGMKVWLTPSFDWPYLGFRTAVDRDGEFKIFGLKPGEYQLRIQFEGMPYGLKSTYLDYPVVVGPEPTERDFEVQPGRAVRVELSFPPDFPEDLKSQIRGGYLTAVQSGGGRAVSNRSQVDSIVQTFESGRTLTFNGRLSGTYRLSLLARQNQVAVSGGILGGGILSHEEIEIDRDFQIDNLQSDVDLGVVEVPYGRARLRLTWANPAFPRPEILELYQFSAGGFMSEAKIVKADPGKDDQTLLGVQMGEHEYRLYAPGYAVVPAILKSKVGDGIVPDLKFELHPETMLSGVAVPAARAPGISSSGAIIPSRVTVSGPGGEWTATGGPSTRDSVMNARFQPSGGFIDIPEFVFRAIPEGDYMVKVEADGYRTTSTQVQVKMGVPAHVKVPMRN